MNLLVIDDDKVDRLMVRELLGADYSIFEAESADVAHEFLEHQQIDCVLLDYLIPGVDSLSLLSDISAKRLPVIMLTGEGNEQIAVKAMKKGARDYINKNSISEDLLSKTISNVVSTNRLERQLAEKQEEVTYANDQLRRKVSELEQLNSDLQSFIHIAAHDLREPVKYLCGYCDVLQRELGASLVGRSQEHIAAIVRSSRRLAELIDDLRELTRIVYLKAELQSVDLNVLIEDLIKEFEHEISTRRIRITKQILPIAQGYKVLLSELYRNLFENALKYGANAEMQIDFTSEDQSGTLVLGLKNSGSEIEPQERERIFQPFYRCAANQKKEGTGIGLTLCRKIVERHAGRIWVESDQALGVHFKFTLG